MASLPAPPDGFHSQLIGAEVRDVKDKPDAIEAELIDELY
jgi:hypothetical protein